MNCESVYSLRYQVYCHEANFLNPEDYSDGLEHDEFDPVSEHYSVTNPTNRNEAIEELSDSFDGRCSILFRL